MKILLQSTALALSALLLIGTLASCTRVEDDSSQPAAGSSIVSSETDIESTVSSEPEIVINKDDWNLILVNIDHPLEKELTDHLTNLTVAKNTNGRKFDERAAEFLYEMFDAAKTEGINLYSRSTHRTIALQTTYYDWHINKYMNQGMTREEAIQKTLEYTAKPGSSEHHTGLAIDITTDEWEAAGKGLSTSFEDTDAGIWLRENAHKYGFILRYPKEKEAITKIKYEPWHFRYVGKEHAARIYEQGLCLEEYLENAR